MLEHQFDGPHQIVFQSLDLVVRMIDQGLDIALQMSPAPLQSLGLPIHLGSVAVDDAAVIVAEQLGQGVTLVAGENRKDGKQSSHRRPQPSLLVGLLGGCFVHEDLRLFSQRLLQLVVG